MEKEQYVRTADLNEILGRLVTADYYLGRCPVFHGENPHLGALKAVQDAIKVIEKIIFPATEGENS